MAEIRQVKVLCAAGAIEPCEVQIISVVPGEIHFSGAGMKQSPFGGSDLFSAFLSLREDLEKYGGRLLCAGARVNVWPSGMSRSMGGGLKAYVMVLGRPATEKVDIFDEAILEQIGTVGEQRHFHDNWCKSLRMKLRLFLAHPDALMCDAFRTRFSALPNVEIHQKRFEELPGHDCFVTAGNSFGMMTAGIDAAVVAFFGRSIMGVVQRHILEHFLGEQPIGTAFLLETGHAGVPFLVHAPTMRVPASIDKTANIYLATWAALLAIRDHNRSPAGEESPICSVAFPAFGTGFGQVPFDEAARQMAAAYALFLEPPERLDWDTIIARQKRTHYDGGSLVIRS